MKADMVPDTADFQLNEPLLDENRPRDKRFAPSLVGAAAIGSFLFGYVICVLNTCGALIAVVFEWCGNEWQSECSQGSFNSSFANASIYLGATVGAFLVGRPSVRELGCRKALCLADLFFISGSILCCTAIDIGPLALGRTMCGVGLGLCGVITPLFIAEIAPTHRRGAYSAMHQVGISLGILASIAMGLPQSPAPTSAADGPLEGLDTWWWRFLLGFPAVLAALQLVLFTWLLPFDSPAQLVRNGDTEKAEDTLRKIYVDYTVDGQNDTDGMARRQLMELTVAAQEASEAPNISLTAAFLDPFFRYPLVLGVFLAILQQLCGINALMSYSNLMFRKAGVALDNLTLASTAMACGNVVVSLGCSRLLDGWGRRTLLLVGVGIQAVMMSTLCVVGGIHAMPILVAVCFTLFVMAFSIGLGPVTWLYLSEIYPMEIRGQALGLCGVSNWLASFSVVWAAPFLNLQEDYALFGSICIIGCFVIHVWVLETKGCSMDDSPLTPRESRRSSRTLTPVKGSVDFPALSTGPPSSVGLDQDF